MRASAGERMRKKDTFFRDCSPPPLVPHRSSEQTDGGGGAIKGQTDERREREMEEDETADDWLSTVWSDSNFLERFSCSSICPSLSVCLSPLNKKPLQLEKELWRPGEEKLTTGGCVED